MNFFKIVLFFIVLSTIIINEVIAQDDAEGVVSQAEYSNSQKIFKDRLLVSAYACVPAFGGTDSKCKRTPFSVIEVRWYHPSSPRRRGFSRFLPMNQPSNPDIGGGATFTQETNTGPIPDGLPETMVVAVNSVDPEAGGVANKLSALKNSHTNTPLRHGGLTSYSIQANLVMPSFFFGIDYIEDNLTFQSFFGAGFARFRKKTNASDLHYVTPNYDKQFPMITYGADFGFMPPFLNNNFVELRLQLRLQSYFPPKNFEYLGIVNTPNGQERFFFIDKAAPITKIDLLFGIGILL